MGNVKPDWVKLYTVVLCLLLFGFIFNTMFKTSGDPVFYVFSFVMFLPPWLRVWDVL